MFYANSIAHSNPLGTMSQLNHSHTAHRPNEHSYQIRRATHNVETARARRVWGPRA